MNTMSQKIELRDYQREAIREVVRAYKAGETRQVIALPTGVGKTLLAAAIAKRFNRPVLFLAHRDELITQTYNTFKLYWPEASVGICKAERFEIENQILIGSVQSCASDKRLEILKGKKIGLIVVDEMHHAAGGSQYDKIITALGFKEPNSRGLLLGLSATPERNDSRSLGDLFSKVVFLRSIGTMIEGGFLAPVSGRKILTGVSLKGVKVHLGDFAIGELSNRLNTPARNSLIVEKFKQYASDRKAVAFCTDVKHSQDLATTFQRAGIKAEAVWGEMPIEDRKRVLNDLKEGKVQVVTSCGVLTEGWDEPSISCALMCRATKSRLLYTQCVGRVLRKHISKTDALVLDFADNQHDLDTVVDLKKAIPEAKIIEEQKASTKAGPKKSLYDSIEVIEDRKHDLLNKARFLWAKIGDGEWSLLADDTKSEIVLTPAKDNLFIATLYKADGTSKKLCRPLPQAYAQGIGEDYARSNFKLDYASEKWNKSARQDLATPGQELYLRKWGAWKPGINKAQASTAMRTIIAQQNKKNRNVSQEPATSAQVWFLKSMGININGITKHQASKKIDELKSKK